MVGVAFGIVAVLLIKDRLPQPGELVAALLAAQPGWLVVALLAQVSAIGMFALQHRVLLGGFGVSISRRRVVALAYSRTAIGVSLPAGSLLSAGFAFQQFRLLGASRSTATTVVVLSGLASVAGLATVYLAGLAVSAGWGDPLVMVTVGAVAGVLVTAYVLWRRPGASSTVTRSPSPDPVGGGRLRSIKAAAVEAMGNIRVIARRRWLLAVTVAGTSWVADLLALSATAFAFELGIAALPVAGIYLGIQLLRQIPLTPGGIGVIEASLLAGLISAGAVSGPAAATVLIYRLLSCWLMIPVGLIAWTWLRRRGPSSAPVT